MAESEPSDKNLSTPQRKSYHQNRPSSSFRGRGRANASVSKALHFFGVRDLREILDKKHQEQDETKCGPPPDPSYNYLKDPSRENTNEHQTHKHQKDQHPERTPGDNPHRGYFRGSRGRGRGTSRENRHSESEKTTFIQNPVNIKVELVASTGERNCKIDEDTKLADIKHIPNYKLKDLRPPRNETKRDVDKPERGRGRGQRGGRGRGRGSRGRGRGQSWYPSNRSNKKQEHPNLAIPNTPEVNTEENWDDTPSNEPPAENEKSNEEEIVDEASHDKDHEEEDLQHEEQYYEEGGEDYEDSVAESAVQLEQNLIITSSASEDKQKRMVTFKVDEEQNDQEIKQNLENKGGKDAGEDSLKEEETEKVPAEVK